VKFVRNFHAFFILFILYLYYIIFILLYYFILSLSYHPPDPSHLNRKITKEKLKSKTTNFRRSSPSQPGQSHGKKAVWNTWVLSQE